MTDENKQNIRREVDKAVRLLGADFTNDNYKYIVNKEKKKRWHQIRRIEYGELVFKEKQTVKWTKYLYFKFLTDTFNKRFPNLVLNFSETEYEFFQMLLSYFSNDEKGFLSLADKFSNTQNKQRFSIDKGIILIGGLGVGKTTIMKLFAMNPYAPYRVVSVQEMAKDLELQKLEGLAKYSVLEKVPVNNPENYYFGHKHIGLCIDDMGDKHEQMNLFGNIRNVIDLVIGERYFKELPKNMTFITTNSEPKDWVENYDSKTVDRFREQFNVFWYPTLESKRN